MTYLQYWMKVCLKHQASNSAGSVVEIRKSVRWYTTDICCTAQPCPVLLACCFVRFRSAVPQYSSTTLSCAACVLSCDVLSYCCRWGFVLFGAHPRLSFTVRVRVLQSRRSAQTVFCCSLTLSLLHTPIGLKYAYAYMHDTTKQTHWDALYDAFAHCTVSTDFCTAVLTIVLVLHLRVVGRCPVHEGTFVDNQLTSAVSFSRLFLMSDVATSIHALVDSPISPKQRCRQ